MSDADWTPVVLRRKIKKEEQIKRGNYVVEKKADSGKNVQNKPVVNMKKLEDDEDYKPAIISYELKLEIQKARQAKNISQSDLARSCNLPLSIIQTMEAGTAVLNRGHLNLIGKKLGVIFKTK